MGCCCSNSDPPERKPLLKESHQSDTVDSRALLVSPSDGRDGPVLAVATNITTSMKLRNAPTMGDGLLTSKSGQIEPPSPHLRIATEANLERKEDLAAWMSGLTPDHAGSSVLSNADSVIGRSLRAGSNLGPLTEESTSPPDHSHFWKDRKASAGMENAYPTAGLLYLSNPWTEYCDSSDAWYAKLSADAAKEKLEGKRTKIQDLFAKSRDCRKATDELWRKLIRKLCPDGYQDIEKQPQAPTSIDSIPEELYEAIMEFKPQLFVPEDMRPMWTYFNYAIPRLIHRGVNID